MLFELRSYIFSPGGMASYLKAVEEHRGSIEIFSRNLVGMWVAESGLLNRLVHLWRYEDREDRAAARHASMATTAWRDFGAAAIPLVDRQRSTVYEGTVDPGPHHELSTGCFDILTLASRRPTARADAQAWRAAVQTHLATHFAVPASLLSGEPARCEIVLFIRSESFSVRAANWRAAELGTFLAGIDGGGDHHIEVSSDLFLPVAP